MSDKVCFFKYIPSSSKREEFVENSSKVKSKTTCMMMKRTKNDEWLKTLEISVLLSKNVAFEKM